MPGLFEEFISIENLSFFVKKLENDKFLALAYDEQKVVEAIKKSGLKLQQVQACYFSQIEFEKVIKEYQKIEIDSMKLLLHDDIITQIPSSLSFEQFHTLSLDSLTLSKNKIHLSNISSFLSQKNSIILSVIFLLFFLLNLIKIVEYDNISKSLENKIEVLKTQNNLPTTSIQAKAILQEYESTVQKQLEIRDTFAKIFNDTKRGKFELNRLEYKNNSVILEYRYKDNDWKKILSFFQKYYTITNQSNQNGILKMELKYEKN